MARRLARRYIVGALAGLATGAARADDTFTLRMSLPDAPTSIKATAALRLAAAVARRTNGRLKIEVYPSAQIASQQATVDGIVSGVLDLTIIATPFFVPLLPQYAVFDLPFLFKNAAAGYRVIDGPIGNDFFAQLEPKGIVGLGWGTNGFRELETMSRSVASVEDMKGLRIRIQGGPIYVATFQALGALPVTIDRSEVFTALQQHTIDGMDVSLEGFTTFKDYIIVKHVAMTNHVYDVSPLLGSKRKLDALPAPLQKVLREESNAVIPQWRALVTQQIVGDIDILKKNGVAFTEIQYSAFRKTVDPVYASAGPRIGSDLVERVSRTAGT